MSKWARHSKDVKNEDRSHDVYENKGDGDKMSSEKHAFYTKMLEFRNNRRESVGLLGGNCRKWAITRGEINGLTKMGHVLVSGAGTGIQDSGLGIGDIKLRHLWPITASPAKARNGVLTPIDSIG